MYIIHKYCLADFPVNKSVKDILEIRHLFFLNAKIYYFPDYNLIYRYISKVNWKELLLSFTLTNKGEKLLLIDLPNTPNFANDTLLRLFRYWATQSKVIGLQSAPVKEGCNSYRVTKMWLIIWEALCYSPGHTAKYRSYNDGPGDETDISFN